MTGFRGHRVIGGLTFLLITMLIGVAFPTAHAQEPPPPADVVPLETTEAPTVPPDVSPDDSTAAPTATTTMQPTVDTPPPGTDPTETQAPTVAPTVGAETAETPSSTVAPTVSEAAPQPGILTITVLDDVTGEPVSRATVKIDLIDEWRVPWENGTTDANGQFVSSEPVPAGEWEAHITHTDYQDQTTNRFLVNGDTGITVRLQPGGDGMLAVSVTDAETGHPVAGALVEIFPASYAGMNPPLTASGMTDEQGRWTSDTALPGGQYMVRTSHLDYRVAFPYVWVEGDTETSLALDPSSHGVLTVTVRDQVTGEPVAGATVTILNRTTNDTTASGTTDETGAFVTEEPIPGHEYRVFVTHNDYFNPWWTTVQVDGPTEEVVTMEPRIEGELTVVVVDSDGKPIESAEISVRARSVPYTTVASGTTDGQGRFITEEPLVGGDYDLSAGADGYRPRGTIAFVEGPTEISISLDPNEHRVTFTVVDQETNEPIGNASVTIFSSAGYAVQSGTTGDDGIFTAWKIYSEGRYAYSVTHNDFHPVEGTVDVAGATDTTAALEARSVLAVRAIDQETSQPIAGAAVVVKVSSTGEIVDSGMTDKSGTFETNQVVDDESYLVEITHDDYLMVYTFVDVHTLAETTLSMRPAIDGTLEVVIRERNTDELVSGANVTISDMASGQVVATLQTDEKGRVTLGREEALPGGSYWVDVGADGYFPRGDGVDVTGDTMFELVLSPNVPGVVAVHVSDGSIPIEGATVDLFGGYWGSYGSASGVTGEDGVFNTPQILVAGSYTVWVTVDGSEPVSKNFYLAGDTDVIVTIETPEPLTEEPAAKPVDEGSSNAPLPLDTDRLCILNPDAEACQDWRSDQREVKEEPSKDDDGLWDKITLPGQ